MLTKKMTKKHFCDWVSHSGHFLGIWNGFSKNGQKKMSKIGKSDRESNEFSPLTLTFLFLLTWHFLTPIWQSFFSFAAIKLKISVRGCGDWSHDLGRKLKGILIF